MKRFKDIFYKNFEYIADKNLMHFIDDNNIVDIQSISDSNDDIIIFTGTIKIDIDNELRGLQFDKMIALTIDNHNFNMIKDNDSMKIMYNKI